MLIPLGLSKIQTKNALLGLNRRMVVVLSDFEGTVLYWTPGMNISPPQASLRNIGISTYKVIIVFTVKQYKLPFLFLL